MEPTIVVLCDELGEADAFFAAVDKSLEEAREGKSKRLSSPNEVSAYLNSL